MHRPEAKIENQCIGLSGEFCETILCLLQHHVWSKKTEHSGLKPCKNPWRICHTYWYLWVFFLGMRLDWVYLVCWPLTGLLYQPQMIDDECGAVGGMRIGRGNQITQRKPAPLPLHPTWPDLGLNPGRHGGKQAPKRLSYGMASLWVSDHINDRGDPDGINVQTGLADWIG
jgi:hypothetical protein